jgi:hypothetical protein
VAEAAILAACDAIRHRGPDDAGALVEGDFGFGMRRLSLIDLAGGHQPMLSEDGRHAIVFNGEVYNHLELRPRWKPPATASAPARTRKPCWPPSAAGATTPGPGWKACSPWRSGTGATGA